MKTNTDIAPPTHGAMSLAQSSSADVLLRLLPLLLVVAVIVVIGGVIISMARRRLIDTSKEEKGAIELDGLRRLRDTGAISQQEYEVARDALIGRAEPSASQKRPRRRIGPDGALSAAPGFDLTGEPLPETSDDGDNDDPDDDHIGPAGVPA